MLDADGQRGLVEENEWYINGQPNSEMRLIIGQQGTIWRDNTFYDTGAPLPKASA